MRVKGVAVLCLLVALAARAAEVKTAPGVMAKLTSEGGKPALWVNTNKSLQLIEDSSGKWAVVCAREEGEFIVAYIADMRVNYVTVTVALEQPPKPKPPPDPPKPPPLQRLWVLLVEETADATAERGKLFADAALSKRLKDKGHRWRAVDKDAKNKDGKPPKDLAPWIERAKEAGLPRLFLVDQEGNVLHEGKAPATAKDLQAQIEKVGG